MSLQIHDNGPVRTLLLDRPERRNALNLALLSALEDAITQAPAAGVRVLVLRGAGGNFCAGGDIAEMAGALRQPPTDSGDPLVALNARFGQLQLLLQDSPLVVVSALQGAVMGGGVGLACACDISIADRSLKLSLPETRLGLIPAQIAPTLIARVGPAQARRLALAGEVISAQTALDIGLVHQLHDDLDRGLQSLTQSVLQSAPGALATTKALLASLSSPVDLAQVQLAAQTFAAAARRPEAAAGTAAFLSRKPAPWVVQ
ncbi:MAG: enoyl-CoA hydratase-related protein [Myxococcota bacterium]|nr:enoyl-CoA hydratase-related protein [Myxococcota bacterium]